jgi:hypothetical protein
MGLYKRKNDKLYAGKVASEVWESFNNNKTKLKGKI